MLVAIGCHLSLETNSSNLLKRKCMAVRGENLELDHNS